MRTLVALLVLAAPALAQPAATAAYTPPPPPPAVSLDAEAPIQELPARKVRIYMADGQELVAVLLGSNQDKLRVRIGSGAPFVIARASIRAIEDADAPPSPENYFRDSNASRTFYAPTGFRLRAGEAYFSQKELLFSSLGFGVTDHFSLMVGTVVPAWFTSGGQNLVAGIKFGWDVDDVWHLAVGAQGFGIPGQAAFTAAGGTPQGFGFVFGTATCGTPVLNVTFSLGGGGHNLGSAGTGTLVAVGSVSWRVHPNVALETEHWVLPGIRSSFSEPFLILNALGMRLMNETLAADLGVIRVPGTLIPFPWVDFTYTFGA